jgi:predicted membrane-bound dolichyl-phosphate-mannose-protein mannosyltransferase
MAVFDEHYYLPEARSIIHREALTVPQHPSLGKLFIVAGILTFGDNPWGWRMPSVVFGVASLLLFYFICRRLANKEVALLACFLLLFESLTFVMSNIAMLDVFSLTFMLLAFLFYLKDRYVFSGMSLALSAVCKLTGFLGIFVILTHWLIRKRRKPLRNVALFLFVVLVGFMVLLPTTDFLATGHWTSPTYSLSQQLETNRILTFAILSPEDREMASYPWTWVLKYTGTRFTYQKDFVWAINPAVWILIIPSMGYMLYEFIRRRTDVSLFVLLWFGATYLPWILLVILTDRQTYVYHFYPAVGAICIGISLAGARIWSFASRMSSSLCGGLIKAAAIGYLVVDVLFFLSLTPIMADITSHL